MIQKCIEWGEQAEARMKEAEAMQKKRRKDRLKLFDVCIKQYLNNECGILRFRIPKNVDVCFHGANYKIKYDR